jgi:hypothetical protein
MHEIHECIACMKSTTYKKADKNAWKPTRTCMHASQGTCAWIHTYIPREEQAQGHHGTNAQARLSLIPGRTAGCPMEIVSAAACRWYGERDLRSRTSLPPAYEGTSHPKVTGRHVEEALEGRTWPCHSKRLRFTCSQTCKRINNLLEVQQNGQNAAEPVRCPEIVFVVPFPARMQKKNEASLVFQAQGHLKAVVLCADSFFVRSTLMHRWFLASTHAYTILQNLRVKSHSRVTLRIYKGFALIGFSSLFFGDSIWYKRGECLPHQGPVSRCKLLPICKNLHATNHVIRCVEQKMGSSNTETSCAVENSPSVLSRQWDQHAHWGVVLHLLRGRGAPKGTRHGRTRAEYVAR